MSKSLWAITLISERSQKAGSTPIAIITARTCDERGGALIFRDGNNLAIKAIIAPGQWLMVEKGEKRE